MRNRFCCYTLVFSILLIFSSCSIFQPEDKKVKSEEEGTEGAWYNSSIMRPVFGDFKRTQVLELGADEIISKLRKRGDYLVNASAACGSCHSSEAGDPTLPLVGGRLMRDRFGEVRAANITPDQETGIGDWDVSSVIRAIRSSIDDQGRPLSIDLHSSYRWMSDEDAKSIAVYLFSLDPISSPVERRRLGAFERNKWGLIPQHQETSGYVPNLEQKDKLAYGRYLAHNVSACASCHTPEGGMFDTAETFAGSKRKNSIVGSFGALFSLLAGAKNTQTKEQNEKNIQALLSAESKRKLNIETKEDTATEDSQIQLEQETKTKFPWQKLEYTEKIASGYFPLGGPDIRGTSGDGLLNWNVENIVEYLSTGMTPSGAQVDGRVCPWPFFNAMTKLDKEAIATYIKHR